MPTTLYHSMNGLIVGESTVGGSHLNYIPDALGSVIATVDLTDTIQSTANYKPYGDILASTGTQPGFGWNGTSGYLQSAGQPHVEYSVRARLYGSDEGQWTSMDPLWPEESAFTYSGNNPISWADPSGTQTASCPPRPIPYGPPRPMPFGPPNPMPGIPIRPPVPIPPVYGCIILCGLEACFELCTYKPGQPTGPWTCLGQPLADCLFPMPYGDPDPPKKKRKCPACPPPPPPLIHLIPPSKPHYFIAVGGCCYCSHSHLFYYEQDPYTCQCFIKEKDGFCSCAFVPGPCSRRGR